MANIKITGYPELAAPISTDFVEVVSDPGGTPISKKVQIRNLFKGGGQIAFPATAVPSGDANTFDDYEEGTHDITITCATSGTVTIKAAANVGAYTKTGRVVHVQGEIGIDSVSSPVGAARILLPFTIAALAEAAERTVGAIALANVDFVSTGWICSYASGGVAFFYLLGTNDAGGWAIENGDIFSANDEMVFQLTYIAA